MMIYSFILTDSNGAQIIKSSILSVFDCSCFTSGLCGTRDRVGFRFRGGIFKEAGDGGGNERQGCLDGLSKPRPQERRAYLLLAGILTAIKKNE